MNCESAHICAQNIKNGFSKFFQVVQYHKNEDEFQNILMAEETCILFMYNETQNNSEINSPNKSEKYNFSLLEIS